MTAEQTKSLIKESLSKFGQGNLTKTSISFFETLGYTSEKQAPLDSPTFEEFEDNYIGDKNFDAVKAKVSEWKYVDLLFQLSKEEVSKQASLFDTKKVDQTIIEAYLFFIIGLSNNSYTRTELSIITREINRLFPMPAMILFKHGKTLTLSVINRRLHKRDETKDVLEKVTLIRDINIENPHRAHIEILFDLSFDELKSKYQFTNFVELHNAWQKTLDIKELNKKFFNELANWYFWATTKVSFPDDEIEDNEIRNAIGVIRLITRLMFVWFLKEKNLVSEDLFIEKKLKQILKYKDKNKSTYYKAILQNLFFATLNTEMGKRKFRSAADKSQNSHYFIHNLFRYEDEFFKPKETLEKYFDNIPFLNGGLFECLDKQIEENGKLKAVRIDGFSDRDDNILKVPDELFFSEKEKVIDLSKIYGTPKKSKEKVRGLIDILSSYKFTITENTPIEEEVALDPELLGKVFENLLANYNPETQTTARKQTGSFYTPREIVNYMVDESLLSYLKQNLNDNPETEKKLRALLSYSEKEFNFSNSEIEKLIHAIDTIKIIDPACGSGAFPMGILHKLVHTLHKLDPKNEMWKQRQIEKASAIDDTTSREVAIETIEEAFENNELDYGRKLYLIENCIYGVDIQPIAVQISKLRFFISLIVEQKTNPKKENLGVRPLPNLETKFVAANTLVELEKENANLFTNPEIDRKKEQLKKVRHEYFEARTPKRKENCRNKDKQLRDELAELLVTNHDLQPTTAKKIVAWNPYDQNTYASFFDTEWMFGLKNGFDVVIGNPPYVSQKGAEDNPNISYEEREYYRKTYEIFKGIKAAGGTKINLFGVWTEKGLRLLKGKGQFTMIVHKNILKVASYKTLRKLILDRYSLAEIVDMRSDAFSGITAETIIIRVTTKNSEQSFKIKILDSDKAISDFPYKYFNQNSFITNHDYIFNIYEIPFLRKLQNSLDFIPLEEVVDIVAFGLDTINNKKYFTESRINKEYKPAVMGRHISKWIPKTHGYVFYNESVLSRAGKPEVFETSEKIIMQRISSNLIACYDKHKLYCFNSTNILVNPKDKYKIKFLAALLNSSLLNFYYRKTFSLDADVTVNVTVGYLSKLIIPKLESFKSQTPFINMVNYIITKKENGEDISFFERLIDAMVYELYLPAEIKAGGAEVLKFFEDVPELSTDDEEKNLRTIDKVYKELSNPKHPISAALLKLQTIEEINIIEGRK